MKYFSEKIAIIGAGKIAYSITSALCEINLSPEIVISKNISSAKSLAKKFQIKYYSSDYFSLQENISNRNINPIIFILSVPDSEIKNVSNELSKLNLDFQNLCFIHLSGTINISALNSLKRKGANVGSFHIMQTFPTKDIVNIKNCYVGIESSNEKTEKILFSLAKELKLKPFIINSEGKIYYHLAGVFASNFLINNLYQSNLLYTKAGIKNINHNDLILPLIKTTLSNIEKKDIINSLSGPIERGDVETINNHIKALKKLSNNNSQNNFLLFSYLTNSLHLLKITKKKYKNLNKNHKLIEKILMNELKKMEINLLNFKNILS